MRTKRKWACAAEARAPLRSTTTTKARFMAGFSRLVLPGDILRGPRTRSLGLPPFQDEKAHLLLEFGRPFGVEVAEATLAGVALDFVDAEHLRILQVLVFHKDVDGLALGIDGEGSFYNNGVPLRQRKHVAVHD